MKTKQNNLTNTLRAKKKKKKGQIHFFHSTGKQERPYVHPTFLLRNETINTALPRPHLPAMNGIGVEQTDL